MEAGQVVGGVRGRTINRPARLKSSKHSVRRQWRGYQASERAAHFNYLKQMKQQHRISRLLGGGDERATVAQISSRNRWAAMRGRISLSIKKSQTLIVLSVTWARTKSKREKSDTHKPPTNTNTHRWFWCVWRFGPTESESEFTSCWSVRKRRWWVLKITRLETRQKQCCLFSCTKVKIFEWMGVSRSYTQEQGNATQYVNDLPANLLYSF